jgi:hypothetical protein
VCFMHMVAESQTEGLVLLPTLRLGRLYNELSDGKKVYLSTEGQLVCEHGELASNISYWCAMEKKAKVDGLYYSVLPTQGVSAISDAATPSPPSRRETARPPATLAHARPPLEAVARTSAPCARA